MKSIAMFENLRRVGIVLLLSFGVFVLRIFLGGIGAIVAGPILALLDLLIAQQWWEGDVSFRAVLLLVLVGFFGQVIGTLGVGAYCVIGRFYQKPVTYGIIIVCTSFLFYFLSFQLGGHHSLLAEKAFALVEIIIFILTIGALFIGNRLGKKLVARRKKRGQSDFLFLLGKKEKEGLFN